MKPSGTFPVLQWTAPMPLTLFVALQTAVHRACQEEGYHAFYELADGVGVVHVRPRRRRRRATRAAGPP